MYYYTADLHFDFEDIISHCNRPFANTKQMNDILIDNINKRCKKDDVLVIIGDVSCYGKYQEATECLKRINAKKILVIGNHDKSLLKSRRFKECFSDIVKDEIIRDGKYKIYLSHYPMAEWDGYYKGIWHFYGHVHNSDAGAAAIMSLIPTAVNAGVDVNDYMPKTAQELIEERRKEYNVPDVTSILSKTVYNKPDERKGTRILDLGQFKNLTKHPSRISVSGGSPFNKLDGDVLYPNSFDIVLSQKNGKDGLSQNDVHNLFTLANSKSVYPLNIESEDRSAMGYITNKAAEKLGYNYTELSRHIKKVLDGSEKEDVKGIYEFFGLNIFLSA